MTSLIMVRKESQIRHDIQDAKKKKVQKTGGNSQLLNPFHLLLTRALLSFTRATGVQMVY